MSLAVAILGLAALILIHEAGHFFTARALNMRPRRFYIGFPPAVLKTKRKGIEYGIGAIPLGGYVKIPGMHRPAPSDVDLHFGPALREEPSLTQVLGPVKRHLAADDLPAARESLAPLEDAIDRADLAPPAERAARRGLSELDDALGEDAYWRAPTWKRVSVILAGPAANFAIALVLFAAFFMTGGGPITRTVDLVLPNHPAAAAGLRPGDTVVAIGTRQVAQPDQITRTIRASKGRPVTLTVERDGRLVRVGPVRAKKENDLWLLGFQLREQSLGPAAAVWASVRASGIVVKETLFTFGRLVHKKDRKNVSSTVGIVQQSSAAVKQGLPTFLGILGLISLSLAILNLLPLLPLDGGHIVFSIVEGIRGKSVTRAVYERVSAVGIALVLLLFIVGLSNDLSRISGG
jgi:regulator of sigma E protease